MYKEKSLSWRTCDIERRFGLRGARWTRVTMWFTFLLAVIATVIFFAIMFFLPHNRYSDMFIARGITPYPIVLLGFWTWFSLCIKSSKLRMQRRPLKYSILPGDPTFILTPYTVGQVIFKINNQADEAEDFILYHRILPTLSNLRNIGRVSDVNEILQSRSEQDENTMESSYTMINGFLWAIPILGFIGTVLGLSSAIGNFGSILASDTEMDALIPTLKQVTAGLSTAFETTLIALVIALFLQLIATNIKKREEEFLDECNEYCLINVVSRLRLDFGDKGEKTEDSTPRNQRIQHMQ